MKSYIFGSTTSAPSTTVVNYDSPTSGGTGSWSGTDATRAQVVPHAMTLDELRATVTTAPGAGKSYEFTLMVNGSASALTCAISDTATSNQDTSHSVSLNAGDVISIRCTPTGTPTASGTCYWSIRQDAADLFGVLGQNTGSPTSGTNWQAPQNRAAISSTNVLANQIVPTAGVLKNLFVNFRSAPGAGTSLAATLYVNGVATALTTSVADTATQNSDTAHTVSVSAGDKIALQLVVTGTPISTTASFGMSFDPTTDGESFIANSANGVSPSTSATNYNNLIGPDASWNATEASRLTRLAATTVKALYVETSVSPGVSPKQYTLTLRQNTADTTAAVTITDASTTSGSTRNGSITGLSISVADGDALDIKSVPSGTPGSVFVKTSILTYIAPAGGGTTYSQSLTADLSFAGAISKMTRKPFTANLSFGSKRVVHIGSQSLDAHTNSQADCDAVVAALIAAIPNLTHIAISPYMDYAAGSVDNQYVRWAQSIHNAGKKMWVRTPGFNWWQGTNGVAQYTGADFASKHRGDTYFWMLDNYTVFQPGDIFSPIPDEPENNSMWNATYGTIGSGIGRTAYNSFITGSIDDMESEFAALGVRGVEVRYVFTNPSASADVVDGVTESYLRAIGVDHYPESVLTDPAAMAAAMLAEINTYVAPNHTTRKKHITFGPSVYTQLSSSVQADAINQEYSAILSALPGVIDGVTVWQFGATDNAGKSRLFDYTAGVWVPRAAASSVNEFFGQLSKQTTHNQTASLNFAGTIRKLTKRTLLGGLSFTGTMRKLIKKGLSGSLSFVGSLLGSLNSVGTTYFQNLTASLSFTGAIRKQSNKKLAGGLSFTGVFRKQNNKKLAGSLSFTGAIRKRIGKALNADLTFVSGMRRFISKAPFTAGLSFVGGLIKRIAVRWNGLVSVVVSTNKSQVTNSTSSNSATVNSNATIKAVNSDAASKTVQGQKSDTTLKSDDNEVTL